MKVRCINNGSCFTVGKVYDFTNGVVNDDGYKLVGIDEIRNLKDLLWYNTNRVSQFEEVKEMTKDDLKTGMVVEFEWECDGPSKGLIVEINGELAWLSLDGAFYNMATSKVPKILRVWNLERMYAFNRIEANLDENNLIWERQEKSPIQLEIEKLEEEKKEYDQKFSQRLEELKGKL